MKIHLTTPVSGTVQNVFLKFDRKLFEALTPRSMHKSMLRFDGCRKGDRFEIQTVMGLWKGIITERVEGQAESFFVDEGQSLPFPLIFWRHRHIVRALNNQTVIIDDIEYRARFVWLTVLMYPGLWFFFKARSPVYRSYFKES